MATEPQKGDVILVNRGRAERLREFTDAVLSYDQSVVDRVQRTLQCSDTEDDLWLAPAHVPVDPPNVPAIVAAAQWVVEADHEVCEAAHAFESITYYDAQHNLDGAITALREALASTVAPLTEDERELLAEVALDAMSMSSDSYEWVEEARLPDGDDVDDWNGDYVRWCVANDGFRAFGERARDAMTAKIAELRPELAPYLGVGDA